MSYGDSVPRVAATGWAGWWEKNKQYVYYVVWAVVGLFGGNVDRVNEFLPSSLGVGTECVCPCNEAGVDVDVSVPVSDSEAPDRDYSK